MTKVRLQRVVYTRVTNEDFAILNELADERQQTVSQLIRKILIDAKILHRSKGQTVESTG